jgi:hypothetical protein
MKSLNWHNVQTLERVFHQPTQPGRTWKTEVNDLWQTAIAHLAVSDEPHVWKSQDERGYTVWNAYDPKTGRSVNKLSESDVRVWLEERHYQPFWN